MNNNCLKSEEFYRRFREKFPDYQKVHKKFFDAIDSVILEDSQKISPTIIDVGCGNGVRSSALAKKLNASAIDYMDNCETIVQGNHQIANSSIHILDISSNRLTLKKKFDIVLCLNNVLGHIPNNQQKVQALKNLGKFSNNGGLIFLDVNNRYNIANYGLGLSLKNIVLDFLAIFKEDMGDFPLFSKDEAGSYGTIVHLFTKREMMILIKKSGLKIESIKYFNYQNGKKALTQWGGQILFVLKK